MDKSKTFFEQNNSKDDINLDRDNISSLAEILVKKKACNRFVSLPNGSKIYYIDSGWETSIIEQSNKVGIASDLKQFESCIRDVEVKSVLIKLGSLISEDGIKNICERNGSSKSIYKEVEV